MRRTLFRVTAVAMVALVAAALASSAFGGAWPRLRPADGRARRSGRQASAARRPGRNVRLRRARWRRRPGGRRRRPGGPGGPGRRRPGVLRRRADAGGGVPRHLRLDARVRPERRQDARPGGDGEGQDGRRPDQRDRRGAEDEPRQRRRRPAGSRPTRRRRCSTHYTGAVTELVNNGPGVPPAAASTAACCRRRPRSSACRSPTSRRR